MEERTSRKFEGGREKRRSGGMESGKTQLLRGTTPSSETSETPLLRGWPKNLLLLGK